MQNQDKQIDERRDISSIIYWSGYGFDRGTCNDIAKQIQEQGYRKSTDVAAEIFAEIEEVMRSLDRRYMASGNPKQSWGVRGAMTEIAELKNKYSGEGK